jgi:tRNA U34 5-methylaminomethyl-2-thiouridine-forming methyltransferase MnmC
MHHEDSFNLYDFQFQRINHLPFQEEELFNCIFFDAFSPDIQPEVWEEDIFQYLFSITATGGCIATYCSKGEVRRRLSRSGYQINRIPGALGKREMLQAFRLR